MKYMLAKYIRVGYSDDELIVGFGSRKTKFHYKKNELVSFLNEITTPKTKKDIEKIIFDKIGYEGKAILDIFFDKNIIVPNLALDDRYSRPQLSYILNGFNPIKFQKNLNASKVTILGAGGIGNIMSVILATSGVGHIHLVDGDRIETSNLTRQFLFNENDVNKIKTHTLKEKLLSRNSSITVTEHSKFMTTDNVDDVIPVDSSLVIVSADQSHVMRRIAHFCLEKEIPYINIGYVNDISVWGPFYIPNLKGCHLCLPLSKKFNGDKDIESMLKKINSRYQAPSNAIVNTLAATFAAQEIINYLGAGQHPLSHGKRIGFNNLTNEFMELYCYSEGACKCHRL